MLKQLSNGLTGGHNRWLRNTRSICPTCHEVVGAEIFLKNGIIFMEKTCPEHGRSDVVLSREARYYSELSRSYLALMPKNFEPHLIAVTLTPRCTLNCPICFAVKTLAKKIHEITAEDLEKVIVQNPGKEFLLWGLESTEHPQIVEILGLLKKHKKKGCLLSHGLKLKDLDFLKKLQDNGLSHLALQFEGFDDEVYKVMRGRALLKEKMAALENLKRLDVSTSLEVVLAKGVNDDQISKIIDYAVENPFIRQVTFLPLIPFNPYGIGLGEDMVPDYHESLRLIEQKTGGRISLDKLRAFQKLMYVAYRFAKIRKCHYFTSFILVRGSGGGYKTIDEFFDLSMAEKIIDNSLDKLKGEPGSFFAMILMLRLVKVFLNRKCFGLFIQCVRFILGSKKSKNSRAMPNLLCIAYLENCENCKADIGMAERFCQEITLTKSLNDELVFRPGYQVVLDSCRDLMGRP